jgi:putative SOS response-associated peptidase YedK
MCFTVAIVRKGQLLTVEEYYRNLPVVKEKGLPVPEIPLYYLVNGFEHPKLPIVKEDGISLYQWGLIPSWTQDASKANDIQSKTLNAKGEPIFEKPSFRKSIVSQRCLLPIAGFYEWQDLNGVKYPYFVSLKEQEHFSLAAIYDHWLDRTTGEMRNTFSIITTPANPLMEKIHNLKKRMPLILSPNDEVKWIDHSLKPDQVKVLIRPFPEEGMAAFTISRTANNTKNKRNVPEIMDRVNYPELEPMRGLF